MKEGRVRETEHCPLKTGAGCGQEWGKLLETGEATDRFSRETPKGSALVLPQEDPCQPPDLHHSFQQRQIFNPLREARDRTRIPMETMSGP